MDPKRWISRTPKRWSVWNHKRYGKLLKDGVASSKKRNYIGLQTPCIIICISSIMEGVLAEKALVVKRPTASLWEYMSCIQIPITVIFSEYK